MTSLHRVLHKKLKNELIKWRQLEDWYTKHDTAKHIPEHIFNGRTDWYLNVGDDAKYFFMAMNRGEVPTADGTDIHWQLYARTSKGVITYERLADTL